MRLLLVPFVLLALVACGAAGAGTHGKHGGAVVELRATSLGKVLVDSRGRTLYLYTPDGRNRSACYGQCASAWPPLLTTAKPKGLGVKAALLGITMRKDGKHQVTFKGHPLYLYGGDSKAGEVNGEDVGGVWFAVSAKGAKVTAKSKMSNQTTTTTGAGAGYGYGP